MRSKVRAELERRRWLRWAGDNLPTYTPVKEALADEQRIRVLEAKRLKGPARSYEHPRVDLGSAVEAIRIALEQLGERILWVVVGDPDGPAEFSIATSDVPALLTEVARRRNTPSLEAQGASGWLVIDLPEEPTGQGDLLVSASGTFESLIDTVKAMIPGGVEFRGN